MPRKLLTGSRITLAMVVLALVATAWLMLRQPAREVETAVVARGAMTVTVADLGETRVRDLYTVSSPVTGELLRVPLKAGAEVVAGKTLLAEIEPVQPGLIDPRSYAQTVATVASLEAGLAAARARVQEAGAAERLAASDFERVSALLPSGFVSRARHDQARAELARSRAASAAARQAEDAALHSLQAARASLGGGGAVPRGQVVRLTAPVSGTVLRVLQESRRPVVAGTQLIELGDPAKIEIVSDMLSSDAVKVSPGALASIEGWGGDVPLKARVRLVEPYGFTKVSALGVEEQRVNVVLDLVDPRAAWRQLGHGFRVLVRIALWSGQDVLRVPVGALFRQGNGWAAFVVDPSGRARSRPVGIGRMNDEMAEVTAGLAVGDRVILHPGEKIAEGVKVAPLAQ